MANSPEAEKQFEDWLSSQSGYTGKTNKANWWNNYNQDQLNQNTLSTVFDPNSKGANFTIGGDANEKSGRVEGLARAKILTGQNPFQIGQDYQEAYGNIKKRSELSDTGSELLRANKAGAVADTRNELQKSGVKGGAAIGATSAVERAKSYDINNQLMEAQKKAQDDYMNAAKNNANFTQASEMNFGAAAAGKDARIAPINSNGFGTVICTELYLQGYYSLEIYKKDQIYGLMMMDQKPDVYAGYRFLADPVVKLMRKSGIFTQFVSIFALPWAYNMAGEKNLVGAAISFVGEPICWAVGKLINLGEKYVRN